MTFLSVAGYWRQVPNVPEAVKAFVDVQQASPSFAPPPPALPGRVPLDVKGPVDLACRAAKQAWLIEAKRAQFTGEEVSDERQPIQAREEVVCQARRQYRCASTATNPYLKLPPHHALSRVAHVPHAKQMKSYVNASQKRSFEDQLAKRRIASMRRFTPQPAPKRPKRPNHLNVTNRALTQRLTAAG